MSLIRYHKQLALRDPVVVVAFGGWNDAADAATTAIKILIDRWTPTKIAEIDSEDFFVFTEARPTIKFVDGIQRTIVWPTNQFLAYIAPEFTRDVILFIGVEPQLKWKTFSSTFLEVCKHFNTSEVVFLGALLADIPHSMAVPITGASSNIEMKERLREMDVRSSPYEGPTGMIGVLQDACRRSHIPSATLWAAAPHYLAATPNIKVTAALLTYLNTFLSFGLDLSDIQSDAVRFEEQITALVARDPEASAYVHKLEEQVTGRDEDDEDEEDDDIINPDTVQSTGPLPSADSLIRDVEELLRKQRENGFTQHDDDEDDEETE
ncbi:MAG TPA: PAC2 family protein [Ktedonobacteraceae bacterium]|nr:PAC2 family protein [Ktedonobacteraceae bacterium]